MESVSGNHLRGLCDVWESNGESGHSVSQGGSLHKGLVEQQNLWQWRVSVCSSWFPPLPWTDHPLHCLTHLEKVWPSLCPVGRPCDKVLVNGMQMEITWHPWKAECLREPPESLFPLLEHVHRWLLSGCSHRAELPLPLGLPTSSLSSSSKERKATSLKQLSSYPF